MTRSCGPEGKLFGSVTIRDIIAAFGERNINLEKRWVRLQEPYKSLGDYDLELRVGQGVVASIKVSVEPDERAAAIIAHAAEQAVAAAAAEDDEAGAGRRRG